MRFSRFLASILGALILTVLVSPAAKPDAFDKKTVVTFDQDVEIPGWTLPAGTYVFKLVRGLSDRNIVQVWDGGERQLYATLHTVSEITLVTPDRAYFTLDDRDYAEGLPPLLQSWFYPGDSTGWTFLYPKDQRQPSDYHSPVSALRRAEPQVLAARAQ